MSDIGMKVSRVGFPVTTASDDQLLFSSSFPTLLVVLEGTLTNGSTLTHNLGYFPIFSYQVYFSGNTAFEGSNITTDTTSLINNSGQTIRYRLYNRELRTNYSGLNVNTVSASQGTTTNDYGFKVSRPGANVGTADLNNLVSFSGLSLAGYGVRQLIIHQSGYLDSISNGVTQNFSHNLGYPGQLWTFTRNNGNTPYKAESIRVLVQAGPSVVIQYSAKVSSSNVVIRNDTSNTIDVAYVLFKDPI